MVVPFADVHCGQARRMQTNEGGAEREPRDPVYTQLEQLRQEHETEVDTLHDTIEELNPAALWATQNVYRTSVDHKLNRMVVFFALCCSISVI